MSNLDSVLNEQPENPEPQEPAQQEAPEVLAETGEHQAPPAEEETERETKGLVAGITAERQKRQLAEQRAAQLEQQLRQFSQQPPKQDDGPPDPEKFQDNPQEYWRLLARHEARQELNQFAAKAKEEQAAQRQQAEQQALNERVNSVIAKGQAKYQDFDAAINAGLGPFLTPTLRDAIAESDIGEDVSYWLAKNPAEAHRIAQLSERQMVRELTKLESKVTAPPQRAIPQTLTSARDSRGQFTAQRYDGPTPLDAILARK